MSLEKELQEAEQISVFWINLWVVVFVIAAILGWVYKGADTVIERKIFENSYQRTEGLKTKGNIYKAQLAEIQVQLETVKDQEMLNELKKQEAMLKVQLKALEGTK